MHLNDQIHHKALVSNNVLHVVGVVSNPVRYHSRYRLAREWREQMLATPGIQLHMVECAFGDRQFEIVTKPEDGLQVRTTSEAWIKENLINLGVRHLLPRDWKYLAWVDADVAFRQEHWAQETVHQLQHVPVMQPWQHAIDTGPAGDVLQFFTSFGAMVQSGQPMQRRSCEPYQFGHPGFAWACSRAWWELVGGLLDFAILGAADSHMAWSMLGEVETSVHAGMSAGYLRRCREWQARAARAGSGNVGAGPGRIEHAWHGKKANRRYRERWQILIDCGYDPDKHLAYNADGVAVIVDNPRLEREIRAYNRARLEDSIDHE